MMGHEGCPSRAVQPQFASGKRPPSYNAPTAGDRGQGDRKQADARLGPIHPTHNIIGVR